MPEKKPEKAEYVTGLDLGQVGDYSAVVTLERSFAADPKQPQRMVRRYACRYLQRFPLGTPYTEIADRMVELFAGPPLAHSRLVVDGTGVGRPVLDLFRNTSLKAKLFAVSITGGQSVTLGDGGSHNVPKRDLVSTLQVLLQARLLKVAQTLPEAAILVKELQNFRVKVHLASEAESFESWRERDHDDLVLAVALAVWWAERYSRTALHQVPFRPIIRGGLGQPGFFSPPGFGWH